MKKLILGNQCKLIKNQIMLKSKRALVLSVISLLGSLVCPADSEYRTSGNGSNSNTENSHYEYNHTATINRSNVIEHIISPKTMKNLRRNPPSPSYTLNEKTAPKYAIEDDDDDDAEDDAADGDLNTTETTYSSSAAAATYHGLDRATSNNTLGSLPIVAALRAPFTGHEPHVKFAILLPERQRNRRDIRILATIRPVIEMATRVVTGPEGVLRDVRIEIDYRDTQCSSTYGALGAFDIFLKRKPGT